MDKRDMLFRLIYALAASGGRQEALFGDGLTLASEAFGHSLPTKAFPELWFEMPLTGTPWFDLHVLTSHEALGENVTLDPASCGFCPEPFRWFFSRKDGVRQLALSWDISQGNIHDPAAQLLVATNDPSITCEFLVAAGHADLTSRYCAFRHHIPTDWFCCYAGVFPSRPNQFLRVECIPTRERAHTYAQNMGALVYDLAQVGVTDLPPSELSLLQMIVQTPFQFEFQFDVDKHGLAGPTFAASVRVASPGGPTSIMPPFDENGAAGELMRRVEATGLVDNRWHALKGTIFAKRSSHKDERHLVFCYPAFLKIRWRNRTRLDAKAYLKAGAQ